MSNLLLLGMTHFPRLRIPDNQWSGLFQKMLSDPGVPEKMRDPANWPGGLRREWSHDRGLAAAGEQRKALMQDFAYLRSQLDIFSPDFVLIWGDDQYENFREDCVPPFALLAYDSFEADSSTPRIGGSTPIPEDAKRDPVQLAGHRTGAKHITSALIERGFDVAYAYQPLHQKLGHAFTNTALFLGAYDGPLPWPIVPFAVNCYGRIVIAQRGFPLGLSETSGRDLDPPSPPPWRCFDLGREVARIALASPWRIALVASSSWSHAFLTRKHFFLYPDVEADRELYDAFVQGRWDSWRNRTLGEIEVSGQNEVLNWMCLAGAFAELGVTPEFSHFHESYLFNSPKVFVLGRPA
jgi:hypothetical protein